MLRKMTQNTSRIVLPKCIVPNHYTLDIVPNFKDFSYKGNVKINAKVVEATDKIILHAKTLVFQNITVKQNQNTQTVPSSTVELNDSEETANIPVTLQEGNLSVEIDFLGQINDKMRGFYRSYYKNKNGEKHNVCCTQFEATDARWAFPCWDEPAFKATFDVIITAPKKYTVLSNTCVAKEEEVDAESKKTTFKTSPKMSTYLLAFFIGEYKSKTVLTENGIKVSIYTPPEQLEKAEWALEVARATLTYFESYFNIRYPLEKLDMLAISDFVNGAMENWGLVTYRDTAILSDENSSYNAKTWVTAVVAHELAHQWFGNLVTMEWWDQLWLNEGFATFMQALANEAIYPNWGYWLSFVEEKLNQALELDSLKSSHPVETEIKHSKQINEVFDTISYKKGSSVLRMLYEYLGDADFRKGVSNYLKHFSYQNTDSDGLWRFLSEASGKDVVGFMHAFTRCQGYPVVKIIKIGENGNKKTFTLKQERFFADGSKNSPEEDMIWKIPMRVDAGGKKQWIFMDKAEMNVNIECGDSDYVRFNSGSSGFFRTLHSEELMEKLQEAVKNSKLSVGDRFMILSDTKAFVKAGMIPVDQLLSLLESYKGETDMTVWTSVIEALLFLRKIAYGTQFLSKFDQFAIGIISEIRSKLGLEFPKKENERVKKLRADLISVLETLGDAEVRNYLAKKYKDLNDQIEVESDIYYAILKNAARNGGSEVFQKLCEIAETSTDPSRKNRALSALGRFKTDSMLNEVMQYMISSKVRDQDVYMIFYSCSINPDGVNVAWNFFKKNYDLLREKLSHDSLFSRFIKVVENLREEDQIKDAEKFFSEKVTAGYDKTLEQSFEKAKLNLKIRVRETANVEKWLEGNQ